MTIDEYPKDEKPSYTLCINCKNFENIAKNKKEVNKFNYICKKNHLPTKIDFFDGIEKTYSKNDLGEEYFTYDRIFEYCHKINTSGNCVYYLLKEKGI
jgi:hypothetical protein